MRPATSRALGPWGAGRSGVASGVADCRSGQGGRVVGGVVRLWGPEGQGQGQCTPRTAAVCLGPAGRHAGTWGGCSGRIGRLPSPEGETQPCFYIYSDSAVTEF